jgi:hypothetical protein
MWGKSGVVLMEKPRLVVEAMMFNLSLLSSYSGLQVSSSARMSCFLTFGESVPAFRIVDVHRILTSVADLSPKIKTF